MLHRKLISCMLLLLVLAVGIVPAVTAQDSADPCPIDPAVTFTWVSPRGSLEVMDDYPLWVATELGYFDDLGIAIRATRMVTTLRHPRLSEDDRELARVRLLQWASGSRIRWAGNMGPHGGGPTLDLRVGPGACACRARGSGGSA